MLKTLATIILIAGLVFSIILIGQKTGFFSKASPSTVPEKIRVTNISDNSLTVSWVTPAKATIGFIKSGKSVSLGETTSDDRDQSGVGSRFTHHVTLKNLEPDTTYYFKINSGGEEYGSSGKPYQQITAPTTSMPPEVPEPIFGQIKTAENNSPQEALVYVAISDNSPISSYTRENGNFLVTLNNARSKDLKTYLSISNNDLIHIEVEAGSAGNSKAQIKSDQRDQAVTIKLENKGSSFAGDLNGDGVINALDFGLSVKKQLGL